VESDAEDLAVQGLVVGGVLREERVAGADPQMAVRVDVEASAVVAVRRLDAVDQDAARPQRPEVLADLQGDDPAGRGSGYVREDRPVLREVGGDRQAEQAALRARLDAGHRLRGGRGAGGQREYGGD